jgi:hypothetical protein
MVDIWAPHYIIARLGERNRTVSKFHLEFSRDKYAQGRTRFARYPFIARGARLVITPFKFYVIRMSQAGRFSQKTTHKPSSGVGAVQFSVTGLNRWGHNLVVQSYFEDFSGRFVMGVSVVTQTSSSLHS